MVSMELQRRINTLKQRQNWHHFADDIFKCIFLNENFWILIKFSLNFVANGPINNIPVLVPIMAWRRPGDKPLSEPMMFSLLTHICITRSQWVKTAWFSIGVKYLKASQIARFMGPTWDPPGSCRPQMGPMLVPWTLLSGMSLTRSEMIGQVKSSLCVL